MLPNCHDPVYGSHQFSEFFTYRKYRYHGYLHCSRFTITLPVQPTESVSTMCNALVCAGLVSSLLPTASEAGSTTATPGAPTVPWNAATSSLVSATSLCATPATGLGNVTNTITSSGFRKMLLSTICRN